MGLPLAGQAFCFKAAQQKERRDSCAHEKIPDAAPPDIQDRETQR